MSDRGERNHNPGNLEGDVPWAGLVGHDAEGYCVFVDDAHGLRALALDLANQQKLHGLRTVEAIIAKFAPSKDRNDVPAYVAAVCKSMQRQPQQPLDLTDAATLHALVRAIIVHENGECIYSDGEIDDAVASALHLPTPEKPMSDTVTVAPVPKALVQNTLTAGGSVAGVAGVIDYIVHAASLPAMSTMTEGFLATVVVGVGHLLYNRYLAK